MKKSSAKKSITLDKLAGMVQRGFSDLTDNMNNRFTSVEGRLDSFEGRLDSLEQGQEDIKLRLGYVAHRFELVDLQKRVEILERKSSMRHK